MGHGRRILPAIWFRYEISAITVKYHEKRPPLYTFVTTVSRNKHLDIPSW